MDLGLQKRHVVITGGASHIGRAIAMAFADEGALVSIIDHDGVQAERTVAAISARAGRAMFARGDVTNLQEVSSAVARVRDGHGPVDVLVNNVGWNGRQEFFLELGAERWDKSYRLNLFSVFALTQEILPGMVERKAGAIVSVSSDAAFGDYRVSDYGAMKAGVLSFTRSIAKEYGRYGVRANAVTPGMVIPDPAHIGEGSFWSIETGLGPAQIEDIEARTPLRRRTDATDVASTVLFLASERARQLTGQVISVSGGFQMPR